MADLTPKTDEIDALIASYFTEDILPANNKIAGLFSAYSGNQVKLYKSMMGVINPYTLYNNQDRFLNVSLRYRKYERDYNGHQRDWWDRTVNDEHNILVSVNDAKDAYDIRSSQISGYLWASTAILGVGYSINTQPGIIGKAPNYATYNDKRFFSDAEWAVGITRSSVNAFLEIALVGANYYRYQPIVLQGLNNQAAVHQGGADNDLIAEIFEMNPAPPNAGGGPAEIELGDFGGNPAAPNAGGGGPEDEPVIPIVNVHPAVPAIDEGQGIQLDAHLALMADYNAQMVDYNARLRTLRDQRAIAGGWGSVGFTVNALLGMAMASAKVAKVYQDDDTTANDKAIAVTGLTSITFNMLSNGFKAASSYYMVQHNSPVSNYWGYWGSAFGMANGLANITSQGIQINDAHGAQRVALIVATLLQVTFGSMQLGANQWMASLIARGATSNAQLAMPLGLAAFAGAMGTLNAGEIYGLMAQSGYVDRLKELGIRMQQQGYAGDTYLYEMYSKKYGVDRDILIATSAMTIIGVGVQFSMLAGPAGSSIGAAAGLFTNTISMILKGVQQDLIDDIARTYRRKIEQSAGGTFAFFSKETLATLKLMLNSPEMQAELQNMQADSGVDSVVGVSTIKTSVQGLDLAAFTKLASRLRTADFYINRFVDGTTSDDETISLDALKGVINLDGAGTRPANAGKSQLLKFLTPLMAPGEEKRTRVNTGKDSYYTSLEIITEGHGWTITDGAMNTVMDVRNVVTSLYDIDGTRKFSVPLFLNGGAGDDSVFAGASATTFDGGDDVDLMSYVGLSKESMISVVAIDPAAKDGNFTVAKRIKNMPVYQEAIRKMTFSEGKRSEVVEYRTIDVVTDADNVFVANDVLKNVEIISGSNGRDQFSGNAGDNIFRGEEGDDTIRGLDGNDLLTGGGGNDQLYGGAGNDAVMYVDNPGGDKFGIRANLESAVQPATPELIDGVAAIYGMVEEQWLPTGPVNGTYPQQTIDQLISIENLAGTDFVDDITGSHVANLLSGGKGGDSVKGQAGDDTLVGNGGSDFLSGGDGDDYIAQNDSGSADDQDTINGGAGRDLVDYNSDLKATNSILSINANLVTGTIEKKWLQAGSQMTSIDTVSSIENIIATNRDDQITGNDDDNEFLGLDGQDTLDGGTGNDSIAGGQGHDGITGGAGDDLVMGQAGNDSLTGANGNDTLRGGNGVDTLVGGAGIDWGDFSDVEGLGINGVWAILNNALSTTNPAPVPGTAVFGHWTANGFTEIPGNSAQMLEIENLFGTRNNDYLVGNSSDNQLNGNSGDDRIEGKAGNDILVGADGADDLDGGDGDDTFVQNFDTVNDMLKGGADNNTVDYSMIEFPPPTGTPSGSAFPVRDGLALGTGIFADLGTGRVDKFSGSTIAGIHGVDTLSDIQNVVGSILNDTIIGDAETNILYGAAGDDTIDAADGADWIDGGGGNDSLMGGSGNDTLLSDEGRDLASGGAGDDLFSQVFEHKNDTLDGGADYDRVTYEAADFTAQDITDEYRHGIVANLVSGRVDKFHMPTTDADALFDLISNIEGVTGTTVDDRLIGNDDNNYLAGLSGSDTLGGGKGNDLLEAGNGSDVVNGNEGNDRIKQDLVSGTGNDTQEAVANDTIDGGDGIDTLDYSESLLTVAQVRDRAGVGIAADLVLGQVLKLPGDTVHGVDTVSNIEQVFGTAWKDSLLGDAKGNHFDGKEGDDTLDGREDNDFLEGGYGNDLVIGGDGYDTLSGDAGNDTVAGGAGNDQINQHLLRENDSLDGGDGIDVVDYSISDFNGGMRPVMGATGINANLATGRIDKFEAGAVSGFDTVSNVEDVIGTNFNDTLIGNALANLFEGAAGNDLIRGGDGEDVLGGSGGDDTLEGGNGNDFLSGGPGNDSLAGGAGSDYYEIFANGGNNVITDVSSEDATGDVIEFKSGIVSDDLWFSRSADNLLISILGTIDKVTIKNWFLGTSNQLESIRAADGKQLTNLQVATLLDVMGRYAVPASSAAVPADVSNAILATWVPQSSAASASSTIAAADASSVLSAPATAAFTPQRATAARTALSWAMSGGATDDHFAGQDGNDSLDGGDGNDTIDGGGGNDLLTGGSVDSSLASDDDVLTGNLGNDTLNGGAGNDSLNGGPGADLVNGGIGDDYVLQEMDRSIDTILGGAGIDTVRYAVVTLASNADARLARAGINANLATGRIMKVDAVSTDGFDLVSGIENVIGSELNDTIKGDAGANILGGNAGDDLLQGQDGNDSLYGGAGRDTLLGGAGNDLIDGEAGNDLIRQELTRDNDTLYGGGSNDFIDYSLTTSSPLGREGLGNAGITGDLATGRVDKFEAGAAMGVDTVIDVDNVIGSVFNDAIAGDWFNNILAGLSGNDTLRGRAGDDTLEGGSGNDMLEGGQGADLVNGGEGDDRIMQDLSRSKDTLSGGTGIDTVDYSAAVFESNQSGLSVSSKPAATGAEDIKPAMPDIPTGVRGWLGNRGITANLTTGRIEKFEAGSSDSFDTVSSIENITGSMLDDMLYGDELNNTLNGAAGNDTLAGGAGFNVLIGGAGDDRIMGGFLSASEQIDGGDGFDTVDYAKAIGDSISIAVDLTENTTRKYRNGALVGIDITNNIEAVSGTRNNDTMSGSAHADVLDGDAGNDILIGNAGNDTLTGGSGNDSVFGGAGNDRILQSEVNGNDALDGGDGIDTVDYSRLATKDASVTVSLATGTVSKYQDGVLAGTDTLRNIENIIVTAYDDAVIGSVNADLLDGGGGNDTLNGGGGNDAIFGDAGADVIVQDVFADSDKIDGGTGLDVVDYSDVTLSGTRIAADLDKGTVRKFQNDAILGTDVLVAIEGVTGTGQGDLIAGSVDADVLNGDGGDDVLKGNAGDDTLNGGDGHDLVMGEAGNDVIVQSSKFNNTFFHSDTLDGGLGYDTVDYSQAAPGMERLVVDMTAGSVVRSAFSGYWNQWGTWTTDMLIGIEAIVGSVFDDSMSGSVRDDYFSGEAGNDTLNGLAGKDYLRGGTGDDVVSGDDGNDVVSGDAGNDTLAGKAGHDAIFGGDGADLLIDDSAEGDDTVDGGAGLDTLAYNRTLIAFGGIDANLATGIVLKYRQGVALGLDDAGAITIEATTTTTEANSTTTMTTAIMPAESYLVLAGKDLVGNVESLIGSAYNDVMRGSRKDETLDGAAGNDTLDSAGGNDFIFGGDGDDRILASLLSGDSTLDGGAGTDQVDYNRALLNGANIKFNATSGTVSKYKNGVLTGTDTLRNIESFIASAGNDAVTGSVNADLLNGGAGDDSIDGGAGNDTLIGGAGNDTLNSGVGNDSLSGGAGDDLVLFDSWDYLETIDGGAGRDTMDFSKFLRFGYPVNVDLFNGFYSKAGAVSHSLLISMEGVIGTQFNDSMTGSLPDESLAGEAGNDTLNGAAGNDSLNGGTGEDFLTGGVGNDSITGGNGNDTLNGGPGDDTVLGAEGNDLVVQATLEGNDTINGGVGVDTLDYSQVLLDDTPGWGITMDLTAGRVRKNQAEPTTDFIAGFENVIATRYNDVIQGGVNAEVLAGGAGADTLSGGDGDDSIIGGEGDDVMIQDRLDGNDTYEGGAGLDTVDYSQLLISGASIRVDLALGTVTKYLNDTLLGTDVLRNIESVVGSTFSDTLTGGANAGILNGAAGHDLLNGAAGSDTLNGGTGNDTLFGGSGNDVLMGAEGDDVIVQDVFAGSDTLDGGSGMDTADYSQSQTDSGSINASLATGAVIKYQAGVSTGTDTLRNSESLIGTRNGDILGGGGNDDLLRGGAGNDTVSGSAGNDTLDGGAETDLLDYSALPIASGITGGVLADLSNGAVMKFANGVLDSTDAISNFEHIIGTRFNDTIVGDGNDNTVLGGSGNDVMSGAAGNDTFVQDVWRNNDMLDGGIGLDTVDYSSAQFGTGITAGISVKLFAGSVTKYENGVIVATDAVSNIEKIIATRFNDTIVGDDRDNMLVAGDGQDNVAGGAGDDTLVQDGWRNNDTLDGGAGRDRADYSNTKFAAGITGGLNASLASGRVQKFENDVLVATDTVTNIEDITGTQFNDTMEGSGTDNVLIGGAGDDLFVQSNLLAKSDTIDGGSGIDVIDYRQVQLKPGIVSRISYNLAEGWVRKYENGVLVGTDSVSNIETIVTTLLGGSIVGSDVANVMKGSEGSDVILANGGNDTIIQDVWRDTDTFDGGLGFDTVDYGKAQSTPGARAASDMKGLNASLILGRIEKFENGVLAGTDYISGIEHVIASKYNDTITGSSGVDRSLTDYLEGGDGDDVLYGSKKRTWALVFPRDTLDGGAGNDALYASIGTKVFGGSGDDLIYAESVISNAIIDGGSGRDTVDLSDARYYNYANPNLQLTYGLTITLVNGAYSVDNRFSLQNIENIIGTIFNDNLAGDANANLLAGGDGSDNLGGGDGNDTVIGGAGNDVANGGAGNDWLVQDALTGNDTLDGGLGVDFADYSALNADAGINASLAAGTTRKYLAGALAGTDKLSNIEGVIGTQGNDTLVGSNNADVFGGSAGSDVIDGGLGTDTVDYSLAAIAGFKVMLDVTAGTVVKYQDGIATGADTLRNIEQVIGSGSDDVINGSNRADTLNGAAGNDTISAGSGNDVIAAGEGDDRILQISWSGSDTIDGGAGNDTVDYSHASDNNTILTVDLAAGTVRKFETEKMIETDTLRNIEAVIGARLNDSMSGSANADMLDGGGGDDSLNGAAGADMLAGSAGNDSLNGGAGNDVLGGGAGDDLILQVNWRDSDTIDGGDGRDSIDYGMSQWLAGVIAALNVNLQDGQIGKFENSVLVATDAVSLIEAIIATRFNDTITGDDNDNFLTGGDGQDVMDGGSGDDTFLQTVWRNSDTLDGGEGTDLVDYSAIRLAAGITGGLSANLPDGQIGKYENAMLVATDKVRAIEHLVATLFNDVIVGDSKDNRFDGGSGNDTLDGSFGNDTLIGGLGNDVVRGGSGDDLFLQTHASGNDTLDGGAGIDTVDYSAVQAMDANSAGIRVSLLNLSRVEKFDNWVVTGTDALSNIEHVIGTARADTMSGSDAGNYLGGNAGNDQLFGFNGDDTLSGGDGNDKLEGGTGADLIDAGNGDDLIRQDLLLAVRDTIIGGDGIDTVDYSLTNFSTGTRAGMGSTGINADLATGIIDKFQNGSADGQDTVSEVENLIGTLFNDTVNGNAADNLLDAGAGDDAIYGGGGNDTLLGGAGSDLYRFDANFGNVRIRDIAGARDAVVIADAAAGDFTAMRAGQDLKLSRSDSDGSVLTIADWYSGAAFQIEEFRIGNALIAGSDLNLLVATTPVSLSQIPRSLS